MLLTALSVHFVTKSTREQLTTPPSPPRTLVEASTAKTKVATSEPSLKEELKRYEEHLAKLEELRRLGQVSEGAYQTLKEEYAAKIEELKKRMQAK